MFGEYEEYYSEPSEVDLVIAEAREKLNNLLNDSVKDVIEKASNAQKNLDELNCKIQEKAWKLKSLEKQLSDMEEKLEQAETRDIPRKYIAKFVKDATGDFAPGDKVWCLKYKPITNECPDCKGKKKVMASVSGRNIEVSCPSCCGYGYKAISNYEVVQEIVEEVKLTLCFYADRVNYWSRECVYLRGHNSCTKPEHIFLTKEEAEKELERLYGNGEKL